MIIFKSIVVWLVFILAESLNGTVRSLWLIPTLGPSLAYTVSFVVVALLIVTLATLFVPWLQLSRWRGLGIGLLWSSLTLAFEVGLGRLVLGYSWAQIGADYDVAQGGLMPFGLVLMALSPLIGRQVWRGLGHREQNA